LVLFAANPRTMTQLAIDDEAREIDQSIRMAEHRDTLQVVTAWAVRPDDLLQQLHRHRPSIVHFSGHGTTDGSLMLVDANGVPKAVTTEALDALFAILKDDIRLVFLNACYSQMQAEAIHRNIDYVIGMHAAVGDGAARVFAAAFYRALGFGCTVQRAFEEARTAVMLDGVSDNGAPVLLVRPGASTMSVMSDGGGR
jgi:CHAT domain-containing protein